MTTREELLSKIPNNPNIETLKPTDFLLKYIAKLLHNLSLFIEPDIRVMEISKTNSYAAGHELMQKIIGIPSAYTAVDGKQDVLIEFAERYSHMGVTAYDDLAKEVILDFLNLHNGLFVVDLSKEDSIELSLEPPIQEDTDLSLRMGHITAIPIQFSFGKLTFLLIELDLTD